MHLFGLNWQLQELDNQQAFENGGTGKSGTTQSGIVTALAADGEETENRLLHGTGARHHYCLCIGCNIVFAVILYLFSGLRRNARIKIQSCLININHLHVNSSPAQGRWGPFLHFIWWKQCCYKDYIIRMGKNSCCKIWKMGAKLNCSTTF